jgi:hypothetical protein
VTILVLLVAGLGCAGLGYVLFKAGLAMSSKYEKALASAATTDGRTSWPASSR